MSERSEKCDGKGGQRHLIEGARFAADSPLEGDGFELSVPHETGRRFELSFFVYVPETVRVLAQRSTLLGAGGSKSRVPPGQWGELPITG
jgi:hypothetical protein